MASQEKEHQDAQDAPTFVSGGERRSRQGQGLRQNKKKKNKMYPVLRHHVVAPLVSRSRAVRDSQASLTARQTSPTARQTSLAAMPPNVQFWKCIKHPHLSTMTMVQL
jgi:hypothetical protein